MFATTSFGELVLFWLIVLPLAFHGFRKFGKWIDPKGEIKEAGKQGLLGKLNKWFNK
jgi:hypothetical protein